MTIKMNLACLAACILLLTSANSLKASRIYGGFYTKERITNLRNNCERFDWARKQRDNFVKKAGYWVAKTDEELWNMVPGQDLPRCIDVTFDRLTKGPKFLGCLKCGPEIAAYGNYPYHPNFDQQPWKLTCPSCKAIFPTNDFEKYYRSAIDERGLFNPAKGDKSLLFNEAHPDPNDPLHKYGVDDGYGYINEDGRAYRFVGYYTWKYWRELIGGITALSDAYLYTGEPRYAHKAAVLLDRIADVYPDMDWKPYADKGWYHSDGNRNRGKIEGAIWETDLVRILAEAYDKILSGTTNATELYQFLKRQGQKYQLPMLKGNRDLFVNNIDDRILRTSFKAVLSEQIKGNEGMHQLMVAQCAIALNTLPETKQWLDWLFTPEGGNIHGLMIRNFDRDGTSDEGAPGYSYMWGTLIVKLGALLADYPSYSKHHIFEEYPPFSATFMSAYRMSVLGASIPNIGDAGSTGMVSNRYVDPHFMAKGYYYTRDPKMAIAAYQTNGNSAKGLSLDIFSKNPEALNEEIERIAKDAAPRKTAGYLMSGFGMAVLEAGKGTKGVGLANNYGRTLKHGHPDLLNFDLLAFGKWLAPDHGYPEFATRWPSNNEWTGSTLSHNLVYVNKHPQKEVWGGHTKMFKQLNGFGAFELDGKKAYPKIKDYSRTMLLVGGDNEKDSNTYVIDIFRVNGGQDHVYSFHGPPGKISTSGLNLVAQKGGSYAGEEVAKGAVSKGFPIGYSHLYQVERDKNPGAQFMIQWETETGYRGTRDTDHIYLRMHALSQSDDIALANGDPPQNKPGNPKSLKYVLMHRAATDLKSTFVSVLEPYRNSPFIKSVHRLDDGKSDQIGIQINKLDGSTDFVLYNPVENTTMKLPNGLSMNGSLGYIKKQGSTIKKAVLINGSKLTDRSLRVVGGEAYKGKILKMNKEVNGPGWLLVDTSLPTDGSLNGEQIIIDTEYERDACYTIEKVTREGKLTKIYCGPISFVRDYEKKNSSASESENPVYLYDFDEGASFKITGHKTWEQK